MRVLFGFVVFCASLPALAARPDLNSFLNRPAFSIKQVISQMKADSEVRERYRRHFSMTDRDLYAYFGTLRMSPLKKPSILRVYSVPPNGRIKMHTEKFSVGTPVYVDIVGNPVMIVKCGNPLTMGTSDKVGESEVASEVGEPIKELRALSEPRPESSEVITPKMMAFTPEASSIPGVTTTGTSAIPIVAAVPLGQLLLGALGIGTLTLLDDTTDDTPLPEPATIAALGIGLAGILRRKRPR
ncbi:MAG: PEP-CTERM sorting domain-containing protein [Fimbriimonadaceae bacterium]